MDVRYLGSFWCDHCSDSMRQPVWLLDGARLCATHFRHVAGYAPPEVNPIAAAPAPEPPPASTPWTKVIPGLRARPAEVLQHGVEMQGCRNIQLDHGTATVGDTPVWGLPDAALVELVLMASAYREADEPTKAMVRVALLRILHGKGSP